MNYTINHIPIHKDKRPGTKTTMTSITIHNTGNPTSTAKNERAWLTNPTNTRVASYHIVVDDKEAIECIPLNEIAWHAGNNEGNRTSIGIEICESGDQQKTWDNAVKLVTKMLHERKWGIDKVRTHKSWSGKDCPRLILPKWGQFISDIDRELKSINQPKEEHFAEKHFQSLNNKGITVHERRFDDTITRGEVMALLDKLK